MSGAAEPRAAIVTGGGQGIGRATVRALLEAGWRVTLADIDDEAGREVEEAYRDVGEVRFVAADVAAEDEVRRLVTTALDAFGRLDGLVNNAGIMARQSPLELPFARWQQVIAVNLGGAFLCSRLAAPELARTGGAIVNIASTRAYMSEPDTEAYAASKGGLVALTHALAVSLGPRVRVNAVSPGWIEVGDWRKASARAEPELRPEDHAQHPVGRVGRPEDVAATVRWLLSAEAAFITGQDVVVDGGMSRKMIYLD